MHLLPAAHVLCMRNSGAATVVAFSCSPAARKQTHPPVASPVPVPSDTPHQQLDVWDNTQKRELHDALCWRWRAFTNRCQRQQKGGQLVAALTRRTDGHAYSTFAWPWPVAVDPVVLLFSPAVLLDNGCVPNWMTALLDVISLLSVRTHSWKVPCAVELKLGNARSCSAHCFPVPQLGGGWVCCGIHFWQETKAQALCNNFFDLVGPHSTLLATFLPPGPQQTNNIQTHGSLLKTPLAATSTQHPTMACSPQWQ